MFWLLAFKVFFKQIELVILANATSSTTNEIFSCWCKSKLWFFLQSSHILGDLIRLGAIELCWPTSYIMLHSTILSWDSLCVNLN